jgi:hypothetical protein
MPKFTFYWQNNYKHQNLKGMNQIKLREVILFEYDGLQKLLPGPLKSSRQLLWLSRYKTCCSDLHIHIQHHYNSSSYEPNYSRMYKNYYVVMLSEREMIIKLVCSEFIFLQCYV